MRNDLHFTSGNNQTATPVEAIKMIVDRYTGGRPFTTDVAAILVNAKAPEYFGPDHKDPARRDCLTVPWPTMAEGHLNFLNPPYSKLERTCPHKTAEDGTLDYTRCTKKRCRDRGWHTPVDIPGCAEFVWKARDELERGVETFALLASRTDNAWFQDLLWNNHFSMWRPGVRGYFLPDRIAFVRSGDVQDNGAPFPSLLVHFDPRRLLAL